MLQKKRRGRGMITLVSPYRCSRCGELKDISEFNRNRDGRRNGTKCKLCHNEVRKEAADHDPEIRRKNRNRVRNKRNNDPEWRSEANRRRRESMASLKAECVAAYGGKCAYCGEDKIEFMCVDHINGGGNKHRRELGTPHLYWWYRKNNFPEGFRVLCHNCNFSIGTYGYCPHQEEK
jgi:hypothetical protein